MIGYTGFLGPTCYAIISETSSTRLRNKTLAFARMCYSIQGIVFNILNAYMINPTAFGWQGYALPYSFDEIALTPVQEDSILLGTLCCFICGVLLVPTP